MHKVLQDQRVIKELPEIPANLVFRVLLADREMWAIRVNLDLWDSLEILDSLVRKASRVYQAQMERGDSPAVWVQLDLQAEWDRLVTEAHPALLDSQVLQVLPDHQDLSDSRDLLDHLGTAANLAQLDQMDRVDRSVLAALPEVQEISEIQVSLASRDNQASWDLQEPSD